MAETRYTEDHEWLVEEGGGVAAVGITRFAEEQLGEIVFVQLPAIGWTGATGEEAAVVESVKAAGGVKMPVAGTVVEVNSAIADEPGKVNADPEGSGWLFRIKMTDPAQLANLLDDARYSALLDAGRRA
jgi:glycine cleavage system H protein